MSAAKRWGLNSDVRDTWYYRRGFLFPLIGSLFFKFGLGEVGIRFSILLLSVGVVALTYFLISMILNKKIALLASLAASCSWIYLFFSSRIMTSLPATFFLLLAAIFFWKGYVLKQNHKFIWLFGLFIGLAILIRFQFAMMTLPFALFILIKDKTRAFKNKDLWIAGFIFAMVFLPLFWIYTQHYGNIFTDIPHHYFDVGVKEPTGHWKWRGLFYYFIKKDGLFYMLSWPLFISFILGFLLYFSDLALGFDKIFSNSKLQKKLFVLLFFVTPFLVLGYMSEYIEQRYVMLTLPFLYAISALPFIWLSRKAKDKIFVYGLILLFLLALTPNITTSSNLLKSKLNSYKEVKDAALWIKANSNPDDAIISMSVPQMIYYSERSVYSYGTTSKQDKFQTPEEMEKLAREVNAKYFVVSIFEPWTPEWAYTHGATHNQTLKPVNAYYQNNQPILVIYEFINRTT
jgi:hypothetical protein